jgi:ABC-type sugar transport system ATPase subunit
LARHRLAKGEDREVVVGIRPEALGAASGGDENGDRCLKGRVTLRQDLGSDEFIWVDVASVSEAVGEGRFRAGLTDLDPEANRFNQVVARFPADSRLSDGEPVLLRVAPNSVHLFDQMTSVTLGVRGTD